MILLIGAWYNEVGFSFNFSHKVDNYIREQIKELIFKKYKLDEIDIDWYLNLVVATDSKTIDLEVRGPEKRKRQKMIDYGLWLPYSKIMNSANPLECYIDYFIEAVAIVLANYGVFKQDVLNIVPIAKKEIIDNPIYELLED
jgi:hypothetical protein